MNSKVLDVVLQTKINGGLHHAFPLCIVLADSKLLPWYLEHYISLHTYLRVENYTDLSYPHHKLLSKRIDEEEIFWVDYVEENSEYKMLFHNEFVYTEELEAASDKLQLITNCILKDKYAIITLPTSALVSFQAYGGNLISKFLIYGYNYNFKEMYMIGFNEKGKFSKIRMPMDEFEISLERTVNDLEFKESASIKSFGVINLIKKADFIGDYPFSISRFIEKLKSYLRSSLNSAKNYYMTNPWLDIDPYTWVNIESLETTGFGIGNYSLLSYAIGKIIKGGEIFISVTSFQIILEHKQVLLERFSYFSLMFNLSGELSHTLTKLQEVINNIYWIKILFMKYVTTGEVTGLHKVLPLLDTTLDLERQCIEKAIVVLENAESAFGNGIR